MGKIKEIFGVADSGRSVESDDIDRELEKETNEELREELRRAKIAKIRTYRIKNELKARKYARLMEEEGSLGEEEEMVSKKPKQEGGVSIADVEVAKELSKLPEEDQRRILTMVTMLKSTPSTNNQAALLMPLMLMYGTQGQTQGKSSELDVFAKSLAVAKEIAEGQGSQKVDVAGIMKSMAETIKTLKDMNPKEGSELVNELAKRTLARLDQGPPRSFLEEIMEDETKQKMIERFFGSKVDKDVLEIQRQMENDRRKWDLMLRKLDYENKLRTSQLLNEARKGEMIQNGMKQVLGAFTQSLAEQGGMPGTIQASEQPLGYAQPSVLAKRLPKNLSTLKCERCGFDIKFVDDPEISRLTCPKCGMVYARNQGGSEPESQPVSGLSDQVAKPEDSVGSGSGSS